MIQNDYSMQFTAKIQICSIMISGRIFAGISGAGVEDRCSIKAQVMFYIVETLLWNFNFRNLQLAQCWGLKTWTRILEVSRKRKIGFHLKRVFILSLDGKEKEIGLQLHFCNSTYLNFLNHRSTQNQVLYSEGKICFNQIKALAH